MKKLLIIGFVICMGICFCGNAFGQTVYETTSGIIEDCNGTRLIALALANGQNMFSNNPVGEFSLEVPLDTNGEITLLVFVAGFLPYKAILTPQEALNVSVILYKCEEVDYCYDPYAYVTFVNCAAFQRQCLKSKINYTTRSLLI